ncbi:heterodimeric geranylgeranyl pyrophosphate synthase small subunit, chloroplastic-like [Durio zibethinus]|uniref:Heterodimeric geranylgeranyl pyrophosphate synthase small subunit, chloroplastic-like n=1 Tax=Durio zibethinus TaxID=66656 RepID=A0A6P5ZNG8_DURZI|nr:heterodimeric geranylgeranyl pyrophosphate synthase small subunit, chloroplastic-like [Durio zibethinus]
MARALSYINGNATLPVPCRPNPSRPCALLLPYRPLKVTVSCNRSYWASINSDIEAHLKKAIQAREPPCVFDPMHHLTFAAPRNTAPALCVAACELVGGHRDQALPAASALHLIYAASFTHEHLPLTESSRPKSAIQHVYRPNIELLIGDATLPFGLELLAKSDDPNQNKSDRVLQVMVEITRAAGSQEMIYGQYCEVETCQSDNKESCHSHIGEIERICEKYDGAMHACGAACGAILGGGSEEEIEKMRSYGLYIGKIQGMINRIGSHDKDLNKLVDGLRDLAIKELRGFNEAKAKAISSFF